MRSVEWFDSGDFGRDTLREHIEMYRLDKEDLREGEASDKTPDNR
jgi:hypothetical protein